MVTLKTTLELQQCNNNRKQRVISCCFHVTHHILPQMSSPLTERDGVTKHHINAQANYIHCHQFT